MKSIIFSTSQTANTVLDNLRFNNEFDKYNFIGILDDDINKHSKTYYGLKVIGSFVDIQKIIFEQGITHFALGMAAVKHMKIKYQLFKFCIGLGLTPIDSINNAIYISEKAKIGKGQLMLPFVSISPDSVIGDNCSLHSNVSILEECILGNNVMVTGNSFVGGGCTLEDSVYIGPGSVIGSGVKIGKNTIVGGGSLVLKNLPENSVCMGNPINTIRTNTIYKEAQEWLRKK